MAQLIRNLYKVVIQNAQSSPTPVPFQQLLILDLSDIVSQPLELLNLRFCADNGCQSPLYAWVESYNSDFSSVYVWVKIPYQIPANSQFSLYISKQSVIQYPFTGMAPQLTATYAQYDNGENVFTFYDNFAGTSLNTNKWLQYTSNTTITVNNGLEISANGSTSVSSYGGIVTNNAYPNNWIYEAFLVSFSVASSGYNSAQGIGLQDGNSDTADGYQYTSYNNKNPNGGTISYGTLSSGIYGVEAGPNFPSSNAILSAYWIATGNGAFGVNYNFVKFTDTTYSPSSDINFVIGGWYNAQGSVTNWYWARARAFPPNGVMPSLVAFLGV